MIIVIGSVTTQDNTDAEIQRLALEHVRRSRTEPGCMSHEVSRDVEQPHRLVFTERWSDMAALQLHFQVDASRQFAKAMAQLGVGKPVMAIYQATPVG